MNFAKHYDIIIIGGGAVGCAIAYTLAEYSVSVALLEKELDVAMGTSGKNSAVVHAGFNNLPGSIMAKLCVEGNKNFESYCNRLAVPYKKCGKLVTALDETDLPLIDELFLQGEKNGCAGLFLLGKEEMNKLEPLVGGIKALYSSNTAVINPFIYTIHLAETAINNGVDFYLNSEVSSIEKSGGSYRVTAGKQTFSAEILINSAGLYSDKVAAMAGDTRFKIYPARGEYYILDKSVSELISRPVYPVPRKGVGGLGVHLTTTVEGNVLIGPSAEYVGSPEEYETTDKAMEKLWREAKLLLPQLDRDMIIGAYTGIRSKITPKGDANFGDFIIEESSKSENLINLVGIESPGLTASIPISNMVAEIIKDKHGLTKKENYNPNYEADEKPEYGEIFCRCNNITRREIENAINNKLGAKTIVSIKNRTTATMGRCNGGYCLTKIIDALLASGMEPEEIVWRKNGDMPLIGRVK